MAQISTNEFHQGAKVEIDSIPYIIVSNEFVKPGKGQAFNRVKLKHLMTGRVIERTFKSGEKVDLADVSEAQMRMLYREGGGVVFMDDTSFEQVNVNDEVIGQTSQWLMEDLLYTIIFYNGQPISIEPPMFMEMLVKETAPGERGNTASGRVLKPAITESGAKIQIPIFVDEGEKIRIDTRTGEYVGRVSS